MIINDDALICMENEQEGTLKMKKEGKKKKDSRESDK